MSERRFPGVVMDARNYCVRYMITLRGISAQASATRSPPDERLSHAEENPWCLRRRRRCRRRTRPTGIVGERPNAPSRGRLDWSQGDEGDSPGRKGFPRLLEAFSSGVWLFVSPVFDFYVHGSFYYYFLGLYSNYIVPVSPYFLLLMSGVRMSLRNLVYVRT